MKHTEPQSPASLALFDRLAEDSSNWSGVPLWEGSKADEGNLTDLKKKGLVYTEQDDENRLCVWVYFTFTGDLLARERQGWGPHDLMY